MRETRSASQILFGYLPEQTVDIKGRVWKVSKWDHTVPVRCHEDSLRRELQRQAYQWELSGRDGGFCNDMRTGYSLEVVTLNRQAGVKVDPYPPIFLCKACSRVTYNTANRCPCGGTGWGQLHFVGYHDCGRIEAPRIPQCPAHNAVRIKFPGTASAAEIKFECPECNRLLQRGFGFNQCPCGGGPLSVTVHRAAAVYTPRSVVIVNAPRPEIVRELQQAGGATRALEWILNGLPGRSFSEQPATAASLRTTLRAQGLPEAAVEAMIQQAVAAGAVQAGAQNAPLPSLPEDCMSEAVSAATALSESRTTIAMLEARAQPGTARGDRYRLTYKEGLSRAGLLGVDLVERFPVFTGMYAYTRGPADPGRARLVPFRRGRSYTVYGDLVSTEALYFRLDPMRVVSWLRARGHVLPECREERSARVAILSRMQVPSPGQDPPASSTVGSDVLSLVHSMSHRTIRHASVLAGIDRNGLSEYLTPWHLGYFVFAAARGGFVLGGLQALFETDLHLLLSAISDAEHRCPLDPGCQHAGSACAACIHLGEPSCRWFNRFLDRRALHGPGGYLRFA